MSSFIQQLSEGTATKISGWHRKMAAHIKLFGSVEKVGKGSAHIGKLDVDLHGKKMHPIKSAGATREETIDDLTMKLLQHHASKTPEGAQYMIPVESSNISSIGYDSDKRRLYIQFKTKAIYQYDDVPGHIAMGLMNAPSHGVYFGSMIRDEFESTRIL